MTTLHLLLIVAIAAVLFLTRSKKSKPAPAPSGWRILYSKGLPDAPTPQGSGWFIDMRPGAGLHYVVRPHAGPFGGIASFTVAGSFTPTEAPEQPALVSLIAYKGGERYYSRQAVKLAPGTHTLTAATWITVDGKATTLPDADQVGIVFGWEAGRGHGVSGSGRVTLHGMR